MRHNKKGYYFSHRKMQFNELYLEKPFDRWHAWEHLLTNAEYEEKDIQTKKGIVHLMPGQLLIGERDFAEEVGWTRKKVIHFLGTLEGAKMVTTERTAKGTIVTIVNWAFYQNKGTNEGTNKGTAKRANKGTLYKNIKNNPKESKEKIEPEGSDSETENEPDWQAIWDSLPDATPGIEGAEE